MKTPFLCNSLTLREPHPHHSIVISTTSLSPQSIQSASSEFILLIRKEILSRFPLELMISLYTRELKASNASLLQVLLLFLLCQFQCLYVLRPPPLFSGLHPIPSSSHLETTALFLSL